MAKLSWSDIFLRGSIVDLRTSRWTARVGITPDDLGIPDTGDVEAALKLGSHRLVKPETFDEINRTHRKAMRAVEYFSLPFGFIRGARYVPDANLPKLGARLAECREEFDAAVAKFLDTYGEAKDQMIAVIERAMAQAARTPEAAAAAVERLRAEYPAPDAIRVRFQLRWDVYAVQGPRDAGTNAAMEDEGATVRSALAEMVGGLRQEIGDKLAKVVEMVRKGGKLSQASIDSALEVLNHVETVNVLGDRGLADQVKAIRAVLTTTAAGEPIGRAVVDQLAKVSAALDADIQKAIEDVEEQLTGFGGRKLAVV